MNPAVRRHSAALERSIQPVIFLVSRCRCRLDSPAPTLSETSTTRCSAVQFRCRFSPSEHQFAHSNAFSGFRFSFSHWLRPQAPADPMGGLHMTSPPSDTNELSLRRRLALFLIDQCGASRTAAQRRKNVAGTNVSHPSFAFGRSRV